MKNIVCITLVLFFSAATAQQLTYENGDLVNERGLELNKKEVRALLATKPGLLNYYNAGVARKSAAGFMLGFGGGLMLGDLAIALTTTTHYPSALTFVGAGSTLVAIPLYISGRKKMKTVVKDYNKEMATSDSFDFDKLDIVVNTNGAGLRLQF